MTGKAAVIFSGFQGFPGAVGTLNSCLATSLLHIMMLRHLQTLRDSQKTDHFPIQSKLLHRPHSCPYTTGINLIYLKFDVQKYSKYHHL